MNLQILFEAVTALRQMCMLLAIVEEDLKNYLVPLPPLAEQKRIVEKLEQLLPLCDLLKKQIV